MVLLTDYRPTAPSADDGATQRQLDYIRSLSRTTDARSLTTAWRMVLRRVLADGPVGRGDASGLIDAIKRCPAAPATEPSTLPLRPRTPARIPVGDGFYALPGADGEVSIVKVQQAVRSDSLYAKRLTVSGEQSWWEYEPGLIRQLRPEMALTLQQAAQFGQLYGHCCICATRLTNEVSIALGIGPICREKMGW